MQQIRDNLYSIQFVANVTGINPHTIRAWEKRYGVTNPVRDKNGRRLYSDNEIQRLDLLNKLVSFGNNISDIASLEKDKLKEVLKKYSSLSQNKANSILGKVDLTEVEKEAFKAIENKNFKKFCQEFEIYTDHQVPLKSLENFIYPLILKVKDIKESASYIHFIKSRIIQKLFLENKKLSNDKIILLSLGGHLNDLMSIFISALLKLQGRDTLLTNERFLSTTLELEEASMVFICAGYESENILNAEAKLEKVRNLAYNQLKNKETLVGSFNKVSIYKGIEVEFVGDYKYFLSMVENT